MFNSLPGASFASAALKAAGTATGLQEQLDRARDFGVERLGEIMRAHEVLDRIDADDEPGEPLDERLARVLATRADLFKEDRR